MMKSLRLMILAALSLIFLPQVVTADQRLSYSDSSGGSFLKFGRHISVSDAWLVVGAPKGYTNDGTSGLVYIYRKGTDGRWVFHSLLSPRSAPLTTKMNPGFFGGRVALSGDLIAVSTSDDDTYWPGSQVFMFRYDATTDDWNQETVIEPPSGLGAKFGIELALEGDLLAASGDGFPGGIVLYRLKAAGWENETVLGGDFASVLLSEGRVVVGERNGDAAYIFEKKAAGWAQTAKVLPPKKSRYPEYGSHVVISGTQLLLGSRVRNPSPAVPMELIGNVWQSKSPLAAPVDWSDWPAGPEPFHQVRIKSAMNGPVAVIYQSGKAALYVQSGGKWTEARAVLPARGPVASIALYGGQIFTGSGVSFGSVRIEDLVKAPSFQVWPDYPQISGENGIPIFDAGQQVVGTEDTQFAVITALPLGISPLKVDVSMSGDTSEFTLSQTQFVIDINQKIETRLRFKPLAPGSREIRVTFSPEMEGAKSVTYAFRVQVVTDKIPLQFTQQPSSGFVHPTGSINALDCQVTGTRPWTIRWFKDGHALPSANGLRLELPLKSTGRYYLEATNAAGTVRSREAVIGYYEIKAVDVATLPGGTARLEVGVTGPGIKIQWGVEQDDEWMQLSDTNGVSGSRTPVLTVRNARQSAIYRAYLTMPSVQGVEPGDATCSLYVVQPPRGSFKDVADGQQLFLGENVFTMINVEFDGPYSGDPIIRVSGLPPGVLATSDGYIDGTPTKTGIYRASITVTLGGFTGTQVIGLVVTEPLLPPPGIYWGWFEEVEGQPQKYAVVADLQASGAISAVVHLGATRYPLAGLLQERTGLQSARRLLPYRLEGKSQAVWLSAESGGGQLQLMALAPGDDEAATVLISELRLIKPRAQSDVPASLGKHSLGLLSRSAAGSGGPDGHGFGSLTVSADHRVTYVGQMPDGSSLTGSSWLSAPSMEEDGNARLYFYQADEAFRTRLYGAAMLTSDVAEPDAITPESLEWQKLPGKGRILADGFDPVPLTFLTSRPQVPASRLMKPGIAHTLSLSGPEIFLEPIPFQVSSNRQPQFGKGLTNPVQARFDLYAPTGFLTGQFSLHDSDPLNPKRTITRQAHFRGMLLPEHGIGVGSFLVPSLPDPTAQPPTTLQSSPIVPGAIKIELEDAESR